MNSRRRSRLIDITGNQYNFLKVVRFVGMRGSRSLWECECTRCGKHVVLRKDHFAYKNSRQKSCGCWHRDQSRKRMLAIHRRAKEREAS